PLKKVNRGGPKQYLFVLLDDALLYCRAVPNGDALELNHELPLETVVAGLGNHGAATALRVESPAKSFLCVSADAGRDGLSVESWAEAVGAAAAARREKTGAAPPAALAPVWTVDGHGDDCSLCGKLFTLFDRKHHCRKCGRLVCHACSGEKLLLPDADARAGESFQRACVTCHAAHVDGTAYGVDRVTSYGTKMAPRPRGAPAAPAPRALVEAAGSVSGEDFQAKWGAIAAETPATIPTNGPPQGTDMVDAMLASLHVHTMASGELPDQVKFFVYARDTRSALYLVQCVIDKASPKADLTIKVEGDGDASFVAGVIQTALAAC
ncbi:lipid binding protein, partial [Aureococcus anophagefferens]